MNSTVIFWIYFDRKLRQFKLTKDEENILSNGNESERNLVKMIENKDQIIADINYIFRRDDVKPLLDFILYGTEETYEDFLEKEMETHEFIKDELSKSTEEIKIREFAKEEFKKDSGHFIASILDIRYYFTLCYDEKTKMYDFNKLSNPDLLGEYIDFFIWLVQLSTDLAIINSVLVDVYTLARIFKKFQLNQTINARKTDEPEEPHNIIIYAGDLHSQNIRRFLHEKLGFEPISEWKGDPDIDFCVDIRNFEQPFFSSWPPEKFTRDEDEMYI